MKVMQLEIGNKLLKEIELLQKEIKDANTLRQNWFYCVFVGRTSISGDNDFECIMDIDNDTKRKFIDDYYNWLNERLAKCKEEFENL